MKSRWTEFGLAAAVGLALAVFRTRGISQHFFMLTDQIRDWRVALAPFTKMPLVGSPTHVGGYTIGPAFYWILWIIRVVIGPWFQNLPHAGGIGQALLLSAVDALFLLAVWRRTRSASLAFAATALLSTAPLELSLAPVIWNPIFGLLLSKAAIALVLLDWHRASLLHVAAIAAIAWSAVHAYTGAIFVALTVFASIVVEDVLRRDWRIVSKRAAVIAATVTALQVPWMFERLTGRSHSSGMEAVTSSIAGVLGGSGAQVGASVRAYLTACDFLQATPWHAAELLWGLLLGACAAAVVVRHRGDPVLLTVVLLPPLAAIAGYAVWRGDLQSYYYFSIMPPTVLMVLLGIRGMAPAPAARFVAIAALAASLVVVPARVRLASTMTKMPVYATLVTGSREIARRGQPMQSIRTEFALSPLSDPEFLYVILGGRIDPNAEWRAVIRPDGRAAYYPALTARR